MMMRRIAIIAQLTFHEARRRKVVAAGLVLGGAFLAFYCVALFYMAREASTAQGFSFGPAVARAGPQARQAGLSMFFEFMTLAGLYAVNFLVVMMSVLVPVDTLSGEINSGAIQSLAAKAMRRGEIVAGKWLGFACLCLMYLVLMAGGVLVASRALTGLSLANPATGIALMGLECLVLVSLSIAGGARFSTLANGVVGFGLFGLSFIAGWVEQIGALANNLTARNIGVAASLIAPSESLWRLAAYSMQTPLMREIPFTPFSSPSVPSPAMAVWAAGYCVVMIGLALRTFSSRDL